MVGFVKKYMFAFVVLFSAATFVSAAEDRDAIAAKAKKEKTLVVYNSMELLDASAVVEAFKKRYPFVEARVFRVGSGQVRYHDQDGYRRHTKRQRPS